MLRYLILFLLLVSFVSTDEVYESVLEKGEIIVAVNEHYPPLSFKKGDKYMGVDIELAKKFANHLGVKLKLQPLKLQNYKKAIKSGEVDIIIGGVTRTLDRGRYFWFSKPYLTVTPAVILDKRKLPQSRFGETFEREEIKTIQDLRRLSNLELGVQAGSSHDEMFFKRLPDKRQKKFESSKACIEALLSSDVAGCIADSIYLEYLMETNSSLAKAFVLLKGGDEVDRLAIAFTPGDEDLAYTVDFFIEELQETGEIDNILKAYLKFR
jgi:ABC-type amino acid transport substrate-binding protein